MLRLNGELTPLDDHEPCNPAELQRVLFAALTQKQREKFEAELELDISYSVPGKARFRVNLYRQRESIGAAFRLIPYEIKNLESLGIPPAVKNFASMPRGMVLVTGPTGSGKSTTLAGLIDLANRTRRDHIMTVEDPIEFLHRHKQCLVNQREVGEDTHSFAAALKHVLRQDPDIILVGEMRDLETISVALTAAETGHLVFATLHTQDAAQTIDRVIDVFPAEQQEQVRTSWPARSRASSARRSARPPTARAGSSRPRCSWPRAAVRNLIREGKTHQIYSAMQAGAAARHAHARPAPRRAGAHQPDHVRTRPGEVPPRRGLQPPARPDLGSATMPTTKFEYAVRDRSGKLVKGTLDAENQGQVVAKLRTMGFAPVSISEANAGMNKELKIPGFGNRVKLKDLAIMSRQFATMISSGLSLLRALTILSEQTENKELGPRPGPGPGRCRGGAVAVVGARASSRRSSRRSWSTCAGPARSAASWTACCCRSPRTTRPRSSCAARSSRR